MAYFKAAKRIRRYIVWLHSGLKATRRGDTKANALMVEPENLQDLRR